MINDPGDPNYPSYITAAGVHDGFAVMDINNLLTVTRTRQEVFYENFENGGFIPGGINTEIDGVNGWAATIGAANDFACLAIADNTTLGGEVYSQWGVAPVAANQLCVRAKALTAPINPGDSFRVSFYLNFTNAAPIVAFGFHAFNFAMPDINDWASTQSPINFEVQADGSMGIAGQDYVYSMTAPGFLADGRHFVEIIYDGATMQGSLIVDTLPVVGVTGVVLGNVGWVNPSGVFMFNMGYFQPWAGVQFNASFDGILVEKIVPAYTVQLAGGRLRGGEVTNPVAISAITRLNGLIQGGAIDAFIAPPYVNCGFDVAASFVIEASTDGILWGPIAAILGTANNIQNFLNFAIGIPLIRVRAVLPNDFDQSGIFFRLDAIR